MKTCNKCILTDRFPGISFDTEGVCNFCRDAEAKGQEKVDEEKRQCFAKFKELIAQVKGKFEYDCTVSFSGGKDSTYTLYLVKEVFGLNPLALTFDNGFISEQAFKNIRTVTEALEVDSIIFKADFSLMKKIFRHAVDHAMYSPKTLERASTICTSCIGMAKFSLLKIALEKQIPMMAWGWTPGQAPVRSSIMKINAALFRATQEALRKPMEEVAGPAINRYFLQDKDFQDAAAFPYNISPLAFTDYNEHTIIDKIREFGWTAPEELDANSTNCLLNSFANQVHIDRHGFHPYAFEIAGLVRSGSMTREEALEKMSEKDVAVTRDYVKQKLEIK